MLDVLQTITGYQLFLKDFAKKYSILELVGQVSLSYTRVDYGRLQTIQGIFSGRSVVGSGIGGYRNGTTAHEEEEDATAGAETVS